MQINNGLLYIAVVEKNKTRLLELLVASTECYGIFNASPEAVLKTRRFAKLTSSLLKRNWFDWFLKCNRLTGSYYRSGKCLHCNSMNLNGVSPQFLLFRHKTKRFEANRSSKFSLTIFPRNLLASTIAVYCAMAEIQC